MDISRSERVKENMHRKRYLSYDLLIRYKEQLNNHHLSGSEERRCYEIMHSLIVAS